MSQVIRTAVVGLNMGRNHVRVFHESPYFEIVAVCDLDPDRNEWILQNVLTCPAYTDYGQMLAETDVDAVVIATPNNLHESMTIAAVDSGVKGVYCEKPMAVSMQQANRMVKRSREAGVALMIGHQRRLTPVYQTMRELIADGEIGDVYLVRGTCAGDFLSDGTHTVDSIRYLLDDRHPSWVLAALYRQPLGEILYNGQAFDGYRYGHQVESGMSAVVEFEGRIRAEIFTGGLWLPGRAYQDIEVFGTKGRIWRAGDSADPELLIETGQGGGFEPVQVRRPEETGAGLDGGGHGANLPERTQVAEVFANMIWNGENSIMSGQNALGTQEIVMAAYESARSNSRVTFPITQFDYPLDLMIEDGYIR